MSEPLVSIVIPAHRVRYVRNPHRLGFHGNFSAGFREARGEFIKFLNDDDRLLPGCVQTLARFLRLNSNVTLATSRRFDPGQEQETGPDARLGCIVERRRLLWRARAAGFLSQPHQLVAALRAAHAFAASNDLLRASPELAERVRAEVRALEEEIAIKSPI